MKTLKNRLIPKITMFFGIVILKIGINLGIRAIFLILPRTISSSFCHMADQRNSLSNNDVHMTLCLENGQIFAATYGGGMTEIINTETEKITFAASIYIMLHVWHHWQVIKMLRSGFLRRE